MKHVRAALALTLSVAMVLLAPGTSAWAQTAQAVSAEAAPAAGLGAAGGVRGLPGPGALTVALPVAPISALSAPGFLSAPAFSGRSTALPAASASAIPAAEPASVVVPGVERAAAVQQAAADGFVAPAEPLPGPAAVAGTAAAPLAQTTRAFAKGPRGGISFMLDRLFTGDSRSAALGDDGLPVLSAAASDPALRPFADRAGSARAVVPAAGSARTVRAVAGPVLGAAGVMWMAALFGATPALVVASPFLVFASLVVHEIGHARAAAWFGDRLAQNAGRASLNPLNWHKHLNTDWSWRHPGAMKTLPINEYGPLSRGVAWGRAKFAAVAFAGPAANAAVAVAGSLAYAGAAAMGVWAPILGFLSAVVLVNVALALINLAPIKPLDGARIASALLPRSVAVPLEAAYARLGRYAVVPVVLLAAVFAGTIVAVAAALSHLLIGLTMAATGVQAASAALPAIAALGLAIGSIGTPPAAVAPASGPRPGTATVIVVFNRSRSAFVTKDLHLAALDARRSDYALTYQRDYTALMSNVAALGLAPEALASYNASPVASYRRINAATFTLDAAKAEEFSALLRAQGHTVYANDRRKIIAPVPFQPESADPTARGAVSMAENLKITRADTVQKIAARRWGAPDLNPARGAGVRRFIGALTADTPAQPKIGVVDSGADTTHPLLKRVKQVLNFTTEANTDDIGHGSWVTSMVLNYAPWLTNVTHYKTFTNGGATLDDILKALTAAANDGNLVISNSWGSDDGDPDSPDSKLVTQLAQEGHIMVFAAGNAGPGANTIGSPAIVQFKDPTTGAIRVVAVAATDRNKKVASFSSVGPGTPKTAGQAGFAHRPDLASDGVNAEGAWPSALGDADRTDPDFGPLKAISGTSMSTPTVAGAIALLAMLFGVVEIGPKLDAVVVAVMSTLQKTGKNDADHEGDGFLDVQAAYDALVRQFGDPAAVNAPRVRFFAAAADRPYVDEYRRLARKVRENEEDRKNFMSRLTGGRDVRADLIEHYNENIGPSHDRDMADLTAFVRAHPDAEYRASGVWTRAWLKLTGRAPKGEEKL
jgi:Zn-dependent protease